MFKCFYELLRNLIQFFLLIKSWRFNLIFNNNNNNIAFHSHVYIKKNSYVYIKKNKNSIVYLEFIYYTIILNKKHFTNK